MKFRDWLARLQLAAPDRTFESFSKVGTVFSHFGEDEAHTQTDYAVGLMYLDKRLKDLELTFVPVDPTFAKWMIKERGIEEHRLARLMKLHFKCYDPVWFAQQDDETILLIEGSHRYVAAAAQGAMTQSTSLIGSLIIPKTIWSDYLIEGYPKADDQDAFKRSFSGIL